METGARRLAGSGDAPSVVTFEMIAVLTVASVMVLQFGTHLLDSRALGHAHTQEFIAMMYKELMILGLVAFFIFAIEQVGFHISLDSKHNFEIIHMGLFVVAILYAVIVFILLYLSRRISARWERIEAMEVDHWRENVAKERSLRKKLRTMHPVKRICNYSLVSEYVEALEMVRYHELRMRFVRQTGVDQDFHFATYLKKCKQHVFLELIEIHETGWAVFVLLVSADMVGRGMSESYAGFTDPTYIVEGFAAVTLVMCLVLYSKMSVIYYTILHSSVVDVSAETKGTASNWDEMQKGIKTRRLTVRLSRKNLTSFIGGASGTGAGAAAGAGGDTVDVEAGAVRTRSRNDSVTTMDDDSDDENTFYQVELFWLSAPKLVVHMTQMLVFLLAVNTTVVVMSWGAISASGHGVEVAVVAVATIVCFIVFVAKMSPLFCINAFTGELVDAHLMHEAVEKQKKQKIAAISKQAAAATDVTRTRSFKDKSTIRRRVRAVLGSDWVQSVFLGVVLAFFFLVGANANANIASSQVALAQYLCVGIFGLEMFVKMWANVQTLAPDPVRELQWLRYDACVCVTVIVVTVLPTLGVDVSPVLGCLVLLRLPVFLRNVKHLRDPRAPHRRSGTRASVADPRRRSRKPSLSRARSRLMTGALADAFAPSIARLDTFVLSELDDDFNTDHLHDAVRRLGDDVAEVDEEGEGSADDGGGGGDGDSNTGGAAKAALLDVETLAADFSKVRGASSDEVAVDQDGEEAGGGGGEAKPAGAGEAMADAAPASEMAAKAGPTSGAGEVSRV